MNADGLDQAFDNLGKAIKITAGLKGTDKSITEVFKMSDIRDEISLVLANYSVVGEPNKHLADYLVDFIAQQVKEARIEELEEAQGVFMDETPSYLEERIAALKGDDKMNADGYYADDAPDEDFDYAFLLEDDKDDK